MCFSATASFSASLVLLLVSIATIHKVKEPRKYLFALIPLLFAVQQAIEGILWLTFSYKNLHYLQSWAMYVFLFFAYIFWPVWVPFSVRVCEHNPNNKTKLIMDSCIVLGCLIALYCAYLLLFYGAEVSVKQQHIAYNIRTPLYHLLSLSFFYAVATIVPFFASRRPLMKLFGILLSGSYIIAWLMYAYSFTSIWCFFVAILSIVVYISV